MATLWDIPGLGKGGFLCWKHVLPLWTGYACRIPRQRVRCDPPKGTLGGTSGGCIQELQFPGLGARLSAAVHAQLAIEVVDVPLDCTDGDAKLLRDLTVGQAGRDREETFLDNSGRIVYNKYRMTQGSASV